MKRIISFLLLLAVPFTMNAQDDFRLPGGGSMPRDFLHIPAMLLSFYFIIAFILALVKGILDYRLKYKMIDKGVPDEVVKQFLQPNTRDLKGQAIKWCLILAGLGLGFTLIGLFMPFGIHSLALMAFSLALSFLGYYIFIKRSDNV